MKINLKRDGISGSLLIPQGAYLVGIRSGTQQIVLTGRGTEFLLPATKRKSKRPLRQSEVVFYCGGGALWTVLVKTPPHYEWIGLIQYVA